MTGPSDAGAGEGGRLGGARADFVGSLGRKVNGARGLLSALDDDPTSKPARDELRRRLHALFSSARILRFDGIAQGLAGALAVLDEAAKRGDLVESESRAIAQVLGELPDLAWADASSFDGRPRMALAQARRAPALPITVLVIGDEALARALVDSKGDGQAFECERTGDAGSALQLARAYAPDLTVVDVDLTGGPELVASLLDDPLTETAPVLVTGALEGPNEATRFLTLGAVRCLPKPASPAALRAALIEVMEAREARAVRVTLGEPTLEQLADRLAEELKRALVDAVGQTARSVRVPLGEGTEVLGALWGAIARVQEIVSQRTGGAIRFEGAAPEGAIALAPYMHPEVGGSDRSPAPGRGAAADVRLSGRRVVVADDDPGVTWFISDLLRTAGCEVFEALDGRTALDLIYRTQPELVISDILMPGLDGFALSRALRRDVALRDVPVILLSWKEDLLQRVRELGASAAAYMRKESDARAILARVREVLRPRARVETRLRDGGDVRGRLDDLSPRALLELVCAVRENARVAVRDAFFLYEIEIRGAAPRKASRTGADGAYQSGERALASLLGVVSGRFVVSSTDEPVRGDLTGTLFENLWRPIASARGALAATTGTALMSLERVVLDPEAFEETVRAAPEPMRALLRGLEKGASPRQMVVAREVAPSLLEDVLASLSARGAIRAALGEGGVDVLGPAVDAARRALRGTPARGEAPSPSAPLALRAEPPLPESAVRAEPAPPEPAVLAEPAPPEPAVLAEPAPPEPAVLAGLAPPEPAPVFDPKSESPAGPKAEPSADPTGPSPKTLEKDADHDLGTPSSLADAVIREVSDRSPDPAPARAPELPPIIELRELRPRSGNAADESSADREAALPIPAPATSRALSVGPKAAVELSVHPKAAVARPTSSGRSGLRWLVALVFLVLLGIAAAAVRTGSAGPQRPLPLDAPSKAPP